MSQSLLAQSVAQRTAYVVATNEIKFLLFGENGLTSIGTENLNGGSVVMVLSKFGAILGRIAPLPDDHFGNPAAGDEHAQSMMNLLKSLYTSNQQYFPTGSDGLVVCASFDGEVALPDQQRIFQGALTDLNLPCSLTTYTATATTARSGTSPGKGTVFIQGNANNPRIYIEDVEVTIRDQPMRNVSAYTVGSSSTPPGYGSSLPPHSVTPAESFIYASQSTTDTPSFHDGYYCIRGTEYYCYANGVMTRLPFPPKNVWVFKENGWLVANKSVKWQLWDGRNYSYL